MKVTLKKPHTHEGAEHAAGAEINVSEQDATFLIERGVIDLISNDQAPAKAKAKTGSEGESK